ncbi:MAG: ABC transporter permease [Bryobacterales bacterium]|nr:ABC transporter permease [Bryobacterales bacterium]
MTAKAPLAYGEIVRTAIGALRARRLRSFLTASSMAAAVAAVSLVATVAATGADFVLAQIRGVGPNLVYAYYEAGGNVSASQADYINIADVDAVRRRLGSLASAVAGVTSSWDSIFVDGQPMQIRVLGSSEAYRFVRNVKVHEGRFLEATDLESRAKVCLVTPQLAEKLYGPAAGVVGQTLKAHGLEFQVIGVFSESVETFGQSEVAESSVLVPSTVLQYFQDVERVDPLYVAVSSQDRVDEAAVLVREVLESRHRPGSLYRVDTLSGLLAAAERILLALNLAMVLVASITLVVSGVFIMNTMLISVSERTGEIGIRKAAGATRRDIRLQFLAEALALAVLGGTCGLALGVAVPWAASQAWPALPVRVPPGWAAFAWLSAAVAGSFFGLLPATRASNLDPVEALRHE